MLKIVNENNFEEEVLKKEKVLIDFNADWCGPCKMLGPVLETVSNDITDVSFVSVNVDENPNLAKKYGVMSIPCLVVLENGEEIKRSVGLISRDEIEKLVK